MLLIDDTISQGFQTFHGKRPRIMYLQNIGMISHEQKIMGSMKKVYDTKAWTHFAGDPYRNEGKQLQMTLSHGLQ